MRKIENDIKNINLPIFLTNVSNRRQTMLIVGQTVLTIGG